MKKRTRCSTEVTALQTARLIAGCSFSMPTHPHLHTSGGGAATRLNSLPAASLLLFAPRLCTLCCPSLGMGGWKVGMCEPPHPSERANANSTSMQKKSELLSAHTSDPTHLRHFPRALSGLLSGSQVVPFPIDTCLRAPSHTTLQDTQIPASVS